tara:strand:+ start:943 stop:1752 length:810 start_codon:yes stop_codon:yes gene_type:complete
MKLAGVLDTFFILSLGITFVLLLVLVYHFRKRLNENELKYDKLLTIVNDIVQKLNEQQIENDNRNISNGMSSNMYSEMSPDMINALNSGLIGIEDIPIPRNIDNFDEEDEEDDDEEGETEEDGDEEDDDEEGETEEDGEEDEEGETEDDDDEEGEEDEEETIYEDVDEEEEDDDKEEIKMINISDEVILDNNIESEYIDEVEEGPIDEQEVNIEPLEETEPVNVIKTEATIDYSSMNVSELKKLVKEKQLSTNISKLKKQELIDLLVSN